MRDQRDQLAELLGQASRVLDELVSDYEIVVIDNASTDDSVRVLRALTAEGGLPNLQVFALASEVDLDTACCAGVENTLGDFVAVIDPLHDNVAALPAMLERGTRGRDIVFATNQQRPAHGIAYRSVYGLLTRLYKLVTGIDLGHGAPACRLMSRRVVNFILQHARPAVTYRHLASATGFAREVFTYSAAPAGHRPKRLGDSIDRGMQLLVSSGRAPMRLATSLSLFGAVANLVYSIYVLVIAIIKPDVAPGWVSLSLQQSGMFFLISLVLLVLGEYVLQTASLSNEAPPYHIGQEFTSAHIRREHRLNVEESALSAGDSSRPSPVRASE